MDFVGPLSTVMSTDVARNTSALQPSPTSVRSETAKFAGLLEPSAAIKDKDAEVSVSPDIAKKFEAMVLSQFIGEILREQSDSAFGEGVQGDFYQSVFAEAISQKLVEGDGTGIAKLL